MLIFSLIMELRELRLPDTRFCDYMPETAPRLCIPPVARNKVEMNMHDQLTCGFADIYSEIISRRLITGIEEFAG